MTKAKLDAYKQALLTLRDRLNGDISQLSNEALKENSGNLSNMPIHMADVGSDAYDQEFTLSLLANEEKAMEQIADALDRIEEGTYGKCEECQHDIPKARLDAVPYTRHCVECARKLEQGT